MKVLNPYLTFEGNAEEAFNFYRSVFGGEFAMMMRFKDTPEAGANPPEDLNKIMHIALPIGDGNVLMASDTPCGDKALNQGNNISLSLNTGSEAETDEVYAKLAEGGQQTMKPETTFWGAYFGMLTDRFGIQWMLSYDSNMQ